MCVPSLLARPPSAPADWLSPEPTQFVKRSPTKPAPARGSKFADGEVISLLDSDNDDDDDDVLFLPSPVREPAAKRSMRDGDDDDNDEDEVAISCPICQVRLLTNAASPGSTC